MTSGTSMCGIYQIRNVETNECYVGSSHKIFNRLKDHMTQLSKGFHMNKLILDSWKRFGPTKFEFTILEMVSREDDLGTREIYWIEKTGALESGFNTKTDQYKSRSVMHVGADLKLKLESLEMGSMNETIQQLLKFYEKHTKKAELQELEE